MRALAAAIERERPAPGERWLVAFSGGPDSTALAHALAGLAARRPGFEVVLGHVDHGLDPDSPRRARRAGEIAAGLGLPLRSVAIDVPALRRKGESPETAARRLRYEALERIRSEVGATRIATAHHRDDRIETVLLRILRGAPVESLGGIDVRRGALVRPLLEVTRGEIEAHLERHGLEAIADPTNEDLRAPRNRARRRLLPRLREAEPGHERALLDLGARSARLAARLGELFAARLEAAGGREREMLVGLPEPLRLPALRWLLRARYEVPLAPSLQAMRSFLASVEKYGRPAPLLLGSVEGPRLELRSLGDRFEIAPAGLRKSRAAAFSYTFSIPGEVRLVELGLRLRIRRSPVEPWMLRGDPRRAGLAAVGDRATVRSRRAGDRLRPLGSPGTRKLKELLIDRRVPADERDRLPIVEIGGRVAWVPGITVDEAMRLDGGGECWLAELEPLGADEAGRKEAN